MISASFTWPSGGVPCPPCVVTMTSGETMDQFLARCKTAILAHLVDYPRDPT